jgi:hypothetical protein
MKTNKRKFIRAIEILAPGDKSILEAAERVNEEKLPLFPGSAALEFVVAMEKLKNREWRRNKSRPQLELTENRESWANNRTRTEAMRKPRSKFNSTPLTLDDALLVKSAEYWLKLGQPYRALAELKKLPKAVENHAWALRVLGAAIFAAWEMSQN